MKTSEIDVDVLLFLLKISLGTRNPTHARLGLAAPRCAFGTWGAIGGTHTTTKGPHSGASRAYKDLQL